jgi:hypothetical protein
MKKKGKKSVIRKLLYFVLFGLIIFAFIYISNKYEKLSVEEEISISDYYKGLDEDIFEIVNSTKMISYLNKGNHLIFICNSNSVWSQEYAKILFNIAKKLDVEISYYDLENDKSQKNSNYYKLRERLAGNLTTTDGSKNNLLAPSFYVVFNGEIVFYNIDTVAMKNVDKPSEYWTKARKEEFKQEITYNIEKYYLNN